MKKQIDLSEELVKALTHEAIENSTDFKNYAQSILTEKASKSKFYDKEGGKK